MTDLERADAVIRHLALRRPNDPVGGGYSYPRSVHERRDLADLLYDLSDQHVARAALDAPRGRRVRWAPPRG